MAEHLLIPFPGAHGASLPAASHSLEGGGGSMKLTHTHPVLSEEERSAQLRAIKKLCMQLLDPKAQEERAG